VDQHQSGVRARNAPAVGELTLRPCDPSGRWLLTTDAGTGFAPALACLRTRWLSGIAVRAAALSSIVRPH